MPGPKPIKYQGQTYRSLSALAAAHNVNRLTLGRRLREGMSLADAVTAAPYALSECSTPITVAGEEFISIREAAENFGIGYPCAQRRLRCGWTAEDTFELNEDRASNNGVVYMIYNTVNQKKYIGVTVQRLSYRFGTHKYHAQHGSKTKLHRAMRKLGVDKFKIKVLFRDRSAQDMRRLEIRMIEKYDTQANGYNIKLGGGAFGNGNGRAVEVDGKSFRSITLAAKHFGISVQTMVSRVKHGRPLGGPVKYCNSRSIKHAGKTYSSRSELAKHLGMSMQTLWKRLRDGIPLDAPIRPTTNPLGRSSNADHKKEAYCQNKNRA